jgi:hypothetical protein
MKYVSLIQCSICKKPIWYRQKWSNKKIESYKQIHYGEYFKYCSIIKERCECNATTK